ncbi:MAG: hypothetical protein SPE38_08405 [Prevotella sp.]|nr:hypothetical protein [Prevotella sp.]
MGARGAARYSARDKWPWQWRMAWGAEGAARYSTGDKWPWQWLMLLAWEVPRCGLRDTDRRLHMGLEVE